MDRETQTVGFQQRLHHGVVWAAGSQGATMLAQAGIVILLAKLGSASVLGRYALALSIVAPVTLLTRLQLRDSSQRTRGRSIGSASTWPYGW